MKKEDLIGIGIEDEDLQKQLMILHGKDIEAHKTQLAEAQSQIEAVQGQLAEANTTIEGFKELDVDGIKAKADEYKKAFEQAKQESETQIQQLKFQHALEGALGEAKAKNPTAVKALLNIDLLKLAEDGKISGLGEQLTAIKSENDYLFESDQPAPKIVTGGQSKNVLSDAMVVSARKAAGLPVGE
jgi:hypothetical protein